MQDRLRDMELVLLGFSGSLKHKVMVRTTVIKCSMTRLNIQSHVPGGYKNKKALKYHTLKAYKFIW
jgi:hypothetical protein